VQHHVPRQLVLHSFRLSADFFGAFPPSLGSVLEARTMAKACHSASPRTCDLGHRGRAL
jgi:hypothetical protein